MSERKINTIEYGTKYIRSFKKLTLPIQNKAREKEKIFLSNALDNRLKTHKLHGDFKGYWRYSVMIEVISKPLILLQLQKFGCGFVSPRRRIFKPYTAYSSFLASLEFLQFRYETEFGDDLVIIIE